MSYYIRMRFQKVENETDALNKINEIKKLINDDMIKDTMILLKNDFIRCESFIKQFLSLNSVEKLLSLNFIYFPKIEFLGVYGINYPIDLEKLGFSKEFEFQNSCDQDYEFEYWDIFKPVYGEEIKEHQEYTADKILEIWNYCIAKEYISNEESLNYYRRTALYGFILSALELENIVYWNELESINTIRICPIDTPSREHLVDTEYYRIIKEAKKEGLL